MPEEPSRLATLLCLSLHQECVFHFSQRDDLLKQGTSRSSIPSCICFCSVRDAKATLKPESHLQFVCSANRINSETAQAPTAWSEPSPGCKGSATHRLKLQTETESSRHSSGLLRDLTPHHSSKKLFKIPFEEQGKQLMLRADCLFSPLFLLQ